MERACLGQPLDGDAERVHVMVLVQDLEREAVAHAAIGQRHEQRVAILDEGDANYRPREPGPGHDAHDERDERRIEDGARPHDGQRGALMMRVGFEVAERIVADETVRAADPVHDVVAGIDAQRALDAFELVAVADVDAHGATATQALQSMQSPRLFQLWPLRCGARLAARPPARAGGFFGRVGFAYSSAEAITPETVIAG